MTNVVLALAGREAIEQASDAVPEGLAGSLAGLSEPFLELGEGHFDWVEVRAVGWQEQQACAALPDESFDFLSLMAGEVVQNDDIAGPERWRQKLSDVLGEDRPVHRLADDERCDKPFACQSGKEGGGVAMPGRGAANDPLALGRAAMAPGQVGGRTGLIEEDEPVRGQFRLALTP